MKPDPPASVFGRAQRLARYLQEDPANPALLAEACEAALAAGQQQQAAAHIAVAQALGLEPLAWTFRRARLCLAQRRLDEAASLLQGLRAAIGDDPAVLHDLGYVRLLQGRAGDCRELLSRWFDAASPTSLAPATLEALQVLWLRASHRLRLLDEAWAWIERQRSAAALQPAAQGVASLVALDLERMDDARTLAQACLALQPRQPEALVACACVRLASHDADGASALLEQALQSNPDDGRTWSALGLCSLRQHDLPLAQARLERAVRTLPGHIGSWHALGWSRLLQHDISGALAAFRRALELDRNFAENHGAVGLALALAGERAGAEHHLERAERLAPGNVTGRYARALLAGEVGDVGRLLALAERLLDRPGPGGGRMADALPAAVSARPRR